MDPLDRFLSITWNDNEYSLTRCADEAQLLLAGVVISGVAPCDVRLVFADPSGEWLSVWDAERGAWEDGRPSDLPTEGRFVDGTAKTVGRGIKFSFARRHDRGLVRWGLFTTGFTLYHAD